MIKHSIRLTGTGARGVRISATTLRELLDVFVDGAKEALRFRTEGRSTARGSDPAWLVNAADFDLVNFTEGSTVITIESKSVLEAAPDRFGQQEIWKSSRVDVETSAMQMFQESLTEAMSGKADSDLFDYKLLETCSKLQSVFNRGVDKIEFENGKRQLPSLFITPDTIEETVRLRKQTPPPQMGKISGTINMVRASDKVFELQLDSGDTVRGIAPDLETEMLGHLLGKRVLASGRVIFRPSAGVLRIEATKLDTANSLVSLWTKVPRPISTKLDIRQLHKAQPATSYGAFGGWPGDETNEQIQELLGSN